MKKLNKLQKEVDDFNENNPIGCIVKVKQDDDSVKEWTVKNKAVVLGGHSAVGFFEETASCYLLSRVIPRAKDKRAGTRNEIPPGGWRSVAINMGQHE